MTTPERGGFAKLRHDLRTCVNQILGYSELLKEEAEEVQPDFVPDLDRIQLAARRLLEFLDGLFADRPAGTAATPEAVPRDGNPAGQPGREEDRETGSILVVDDDAMNRDMLSRRLERQGFEVRTAVDGPDALRQIEGESLDLLLLDVMMPGISGLEVLRKVRETRSSSELPIIMATAKGESDDVVEAFRQGANDYVTKPLDFPVVMARIRTQLALRRAVEENRSLVRDVEMRNRFIRQTFGRYLSEDIVSSLLEERDGQQLGGEKRELTIMMTDLRGFTAISERLPAQQVVTIINIYLEVMTPIILELGGTIDEFIGDAILVFFGAPTRMENHADAAVRCAVRMQLAMEEVNRRTREQDLPSIEMGIGINTGEVVVGNIGSDRRAKYGAVGTNVNFTSRVESYTLGGQILISESTFRAVEAEVVIGQRIEVQPKGFALPVTLFEVRGTGGDPPLSVPFHDLVMVPLTAPVPVRLSLVEGKDVGEVTHAGELVKLSPKGAEIRCSESIIPLSNVRITLEGQTGDLYAKVLTPEAGDDGMMTLRFTSVPPSLDSKLKSLL